MANALKNACSLWLLLLLGPGLLGCTPSLLNYESTVHTVRAGETLYTIAWRYGIDYRDLARWNDLDNPDLIFAGQRLVLRAGSRAAPQAAAAVAAWPLPPPRELPPPAWRWPVTGQIASRFNSADGIASGIAIRGAAGQPIRSAAAGSVVYVGTGLAGYGQLIIIKHNDTYLTAYGHTDAVSVRQGESVAQGAVIAAMGLGPRREPRLHFEIRRNGIPVDPLTQLPAL